LCIRCSSNENVIPSYGCGHMDECRLCLAHQQKNLVKHVHEELGDFVVQLDLYFAPNIILVAVKITGLN
jgi:hypothetical protein